MYTLLPRKIRLLVYLLLLTMATISMAQPPQASGIKKGMVKVKFTTGMSSTLSQMRVATTGKGLTTGHPSIDRVAKATKASNMTRMFPFDARFEDKLRKHGLHLWYVVEMDESIDPKTVVAQFKQLAEVEHAEVEHEKIIAPFTVTPYAPGATTFDALPFNDPMLKDQWHYNNTNQTGFGDADVNLFEAWTKTTGANNIIVSVHDQGVDINHKDLAQNIWVNLAEKNGQPNVDDDGNGYVDDINGWNFQKKSGKIDAEYHGTHVAGTIAAVNNNGVGVGGIAGGNGTGNGVKIMSLEILGGAAIEKSYVYAANNGSVISQNSWGYTSPYYYDQSVHDAIDYFIQEAGDYPGSPMKGGLVIFAAGNSNSRDQWYPAYYPHVLSVASLGPEWIRAPYSNYGDWVELAAPGGDQENYGGKGGVLSTIPKDQYAYMQGTSMACPHVSGIAALALANRTKQLTTQELWNKLVTGTVNIDSYNPDYVGMLGSGAIDAALAIQNDLGLAPNKINDLTITGIAQEFAGLSWTVPSDEDDFKPTSFKLYYHTQPITVNNLGQATEITIKNTYDVGTTASYEVQGLSGLTTYYFAVVSVDRWGNAAALSNIEQGTTNQGPAIAVDDNSQEINLNIDANVGTTASHEITILNNAEGILRWNHMTRHKNTSLSFNAAGLHYPIAGQPAATPKVFRMNALDKPLVKTMDAQPASFQSQEFAYTGWSTNIIGETDLNLTNSAAAKFYVSQAEGFNLTDARMYLKHDPALGPVIMEVYQGSSPIKDNLIYAQEYSNWSTSEATAYITLNEQLYFPQGTTFWLVFHVPAGNLFPLGIGFENDPLYSTYCYMSFDMGKKWAPLEELLDSEDFAWSVVAASYNEHLGTYLTLEPGSGDVAGLSQTSTTLTANAETLINGDYSANLILTSNDTQKKELRVPVNVKVSGHKPNIQHLDIADFGSVFVGTEKSMDLVINNIGYGNFNNPSFTIAGTQFQISGSSPWQIKAREQVVLTIKFKPTVTGNVNDMLTFTDGNSTYQISLFGVGAATSKITLTPTTQTITPVALGDVVNAAITVKNTGAYPLKYFIPGFDTKGVSDNWPSAYHKYGYKKRTNLPGDPTPLGYSFQDISTTGKDITTGVRDDYSYYALDMGIQFPYYGNTVSTIYIARKGFTTFDNSVNPVNTPRLNDSWGPGGYISPLGTYLDYLTQGKIYYQILVDRVIIQYENVWDGYTAGQSMTVQMVLFSNGNIRFFYKTMDNIDPASFNILMDGLDHKDGILLNNYQNQINLSAGLALGFDYPGPNIITQIDNGSGILAPGASSVVTVTMNTASVTEGLIPRYINFISNDPANLSKQALVNLNITSGGKAVPQVSTDTIAFGNVFQGAVKSIPFTIKNPGTAKLNISSLKFANTKFNITGTQTVSILPGLYQNYSVSIPTTVLATLEDWLSINYADGTHDTIYVTGKVINAPKITVDLTPITQTLNYGDSVNLPFNIKNPGLGELEVVVTGDQWLTYKAANGTSNSTTPDATYTFDKYNNGDFYQWIDIRKTGTHLPLPVSFDKEELWKNVSLPFAFEFYGKTYTTMKVGYNGIISFDEDPEIMFFTDHIPTPDYDGTFIMPYWCFGGFDDIHYAKEDIGIFYQAFDDKMVITWSNVVDNFGMGDPISAQIFMYRNGTMKFQYKVEGAGDVLSRFSSVGVQQNKTNGVAISDHENLDHGKGLAYIVMPANKHVVTPGATLAGEIKINAQNIYGGVYNNTLKIKTNVPNSPLLEKPVQLTVLGDAVVDAPTSFDFGTKMITFDQWGTPNANYEEIHFGNTGAAHLEISWIQMADGMQGLSLQVWALVDGWFGPEWRWADISELYSPWAWQTPVFKVKPNETLKIRVAFAPQSSGDFMDDVVFTTSIGETRITLKGTAIDPPALEVDTTPIEVMMNTSTESTTKTIAFNNTNGLSNLDYEVSVDYGRSGANSTAQATAAGSKLNLISTRATKPSVTAGTLSTYDRIISHTEKTVSDNFIGTGGAAPFTLATQYNAGPEGFNISHIETFFRTETLTTGTLEVEILAGGTSIANASVIASGTLNFTGSGSDETGGWHQIAMNKAAQIFPHENFYVAVTYPLGLEYPQGAINNTPHVADRYLYLEEGLWHDLQEISDFATTGWLMYAAQTTKIDGTWLSITSATSGTVPAGESSEVELTFNGAFAQAGDQIANVVFKSNDPNKNTVTVPVKLHMNEAPKFSDVPAQVTMSENETKTLSIPVTDSEGNTFTVTTAQAYTDVSTTLSGSILTIELTPDFGDAGHYQYTFKATDQYNAVEEITLAVEVIKNNRAPVFTGSTSELVYNVSDKMKEFELADFFSDPDGDNLTFSVANADESVALVYASSAKFLVQPMAAGTTELNFTVTDSDGAVLNKIISVKVNVVLGVEPGAIPYLQAFPNPASDVVVVKLPSHWTKGGTVRMLDLTGRETFQATVNQATAEGLIINVRELVPGTYLLRANSGSEVQVQRIIKK